MVSEEEAARVAQDMVQQKQVRLGKELYCRRAERLQSDRLWIFSYNTVAFRESRNPRDGLVGNGPIVIDKLTGAVYTVPTGGMKDWLDTYNLTGHPPVGK